MANNKVLQVVFFFGVAGGGLGPGLFTTVQPNLQL